MFLNIPSGTSRKILPEISKTSLKKIVQKYDFFARLVKRLVEAQEVFL